MHYTTLDPANQEIRVLRFAPPQYGHHDDTKGDVIQLTLHSVSLDDYSESYLNEKSKLFDDELWSRYKARRRLHWNSELPYTQNLGTQWQEEYETPPRWRWGEYACLSYTVSDELWCEEECDIVLLWGSLEDFKFIMVNGERFKVTKNLEAALRGLWERPNSSYMAYWIDAICINQEDLDERAQQVQFMKSIYSLAFKVVIWLGAEIEQTAFTFRSIQELWKTYTAILKRTPKNITRQITREEAMELLAVPRATLSELWDAIALLLGRPYWHRLWVVQELALAGEFVEMYWGSHSCLFWHMIAALQSLYPVVDVATPLLAEALGRVGSVNETQSASDLLRRLMTFAWFAHGPVINAGQAMDISRTSHCKEDLDKVYGLLGLLDPSITESMIKPDYRRTVCAVYSDYSRVVTQNGMTLDLLFNKEHTTPRNLEQNSSWPSWVPDFREPALAGALSSGQLFNVSAGSKPSISFPSDTSLKVQGIRFDILDGIGFNQPLDVNLPLSDYLVTQPALSSCAYLSAIPAGPQYDQTRTSILKNVIWRTLVANRPHVSTVMTSINGYSCIMSLKLPAAVNFGTFLRGPSPYSDFLSFQIRNATLRLFGKPLSSYFGPEKSEAPAPSSSPDLPSALNRATSLLKTRTLATTEEGYLALVPRTARRGDMVAIIYGCTSPVIIRQLITGKGDTRYKFLGNAYVHGIMDGEALEHRDVAAEDFVFC